MASGELFSCQSVAAAYSGLGTDRGKHIPLYTRSGVCTRVVHEVRRVTFPLYICARCVPGEEERDNDRKIVTVCIRFRIEGNQLGGMRIEISP